MQEQKTYNPSKVVYVMIGLASFVIFVAGIRAAGEIVVPLLMALFLTLVVFPVLVWSRKFSIPAWLSIFATAVIIAGIFTFFVFVLGYNVQSLAGRIPDYHDLLEERWTSVMVFWQDRGVDVSILQISDMISSNIIKDTAIETLGLLTLIIEDSFLIFVLMIFMLFASSTFPAKVAALSPNKKNSLMILDRIVHLISHYMVLKTVISLITGLMVALLLILLKIDHAIFWGFLAFALNYIPNVGSFLAAMPVIFIALIQGGFEQALLVTLGYVLINVMIGNVVEPKIMGRSTELSVVFIFISLIFWGWVLGPVGMFLSVPLTIVLKIVFEHFDSTRWFSILIGPDTLTAGTETNLSNEPAEVVPEHPAKN